MPLYNGPPVPALRAPLHGHRPMRTLPYSFSSRALLAGIAGLALALPTSTQDAVPSAADAQALQNSGKLADAAQAWKKRADANANDAQAHFFYAYTLHMAGDYDAAHDAHIAAARFSQYTATALYNHACVHALRGEKDKAFAALDEAIAAGFSNASQLEQDSDMDNLRGDGRLEAALLRLDGATLTKLSAVPASRRFDFYLGDWAMSKDDTVEGLLSTESAYDGKGLRVTASRPDGTANAESLFLYDEAAGLWRQMWMNAAGLSVQMEGKLEGESMVLRMVSENGKPKSDGRSVFRNVTSNGFVYDWQETRDGGKSWETIATRTFTRRAAG